MGYTLITTEHNRRLQRHTHRSDDPEERWIMGGGDLTYLEFLAEEREIQQSPPKRPRMYKKA